MGDLARFVAIAANQVGHATMSRMRHMSSFTRYSSSMWGAAGGGNNAYLDLDSPRVSKTGEFAQT